MTNNKHGIIETDRLLLRPCCQDDADIIFALMNSKDFIKYIGDRGLKDLAITREYINSKMLPQIKRLGYGNYVVIRKADEVKLGTCGLYDRPGLKGIDIGFGFLPEYYSKGYAFESAACLRDAAFQDFGIDTLRGITVEENKSSRRLLKKLGLHFKDNVRLPGNPEELMLYEMDENEFIALSQSL